MSAPHSVSEILCWQRCHREWRYAYVDRRRAVQESPSQARGRAIHQYLADPSRVPSDPYLRGVCAALGPLTRDNATACEVPWSCSISGVDMHGVVDAVRANVDGRPIVVETKTTSQDCSEGAPYWRKLASDLQTHVYAIALDTRWVEYQAIHVPRLRQRDGEYDEAYADRVRAATYVVTRAHTMTDAERYDACEQVEAFDASSDWVPSWGSCQRYGGWCEYHDVCTGLASIHDDRLYQLVPRRQL